MTNTVRASRIDRPDHVTALARQAVTQGWTVENRRASLPIERTVRCTRPDLDLTLDLHGLAVLPYFRARLLAGRREVAVMAAAKDVRAILEDPGAVTR